MNNPSVFTHEGKVYPPEANGNGAGKISQGDQKEKPADSTYSTWDDPVIPSRTVTPNLPADFLPGWLSEYVDAVSKNMQTPPGLAVMMALSVVATCIQKRFEVSPFGDDYREPLTLWTAIAMPPASRKTAVVNALTQPLIDWEVTQFESLKNEIANRATNIAVNQKAIDRLQFEAAKAKEASERRMLIEEINKLKAETPEELLPPRLWTSDITPERLQSLMAEHGERMGLISDEGGIFEIMAGLYSDGRANLDIFLQGHAGKAVRVDRGNRTVYLQKPALSFGLAIQPDVLRDFGNGRKRRFRGIGTLARFLYCIPNSNIGQRDIKQRSLISETVKRIYKDRIFKLLEIQPIINGSNVETPRIIRLSPDALSAWEAFAQFIESKQGEGGEYEYIQDWTGKLPGAALRIAGVCHVAEYGETSLEINLQTITKALDMCESLIPHAQIAFDMMGADQAVDDAKLILRWIVKNGDPVFKRSECHKAHHGRFKKVERLKTALDVLRGWNVISDSDSVKTGRRPTIIHHVNPKILKEAEHGLA
ncbi:MAG: DUF3987 domain-containing protein [Nitrospinae bacterium]|nr:DUF3987 domain-containing protein [Nitrospinota bacterium]